MVGFAWIIVEKYKNCRRVNVKKLDKKRKKFYNVFTKCNETVTFL